MTVPAKVQVLYAQENLIFGIQVGRSETASLAQRLGLGFDTSCAFPAQVLVLLIVVRIVVLYRYRTERYRR
jgi:hypothetical protein